MTRAATSRSIFIACAVLGLLGCGSKARDESVPSDTGVTDSGEDTGIGADTADASPDIGSAETDAEGGPAACSSLSVGSAVTVEARAEDPPPLPGGVVREGTYMLTAAYDYVGKTGSPGPRGTMKRVMKLSPTGGLEAVRQDGDGPLESYGGSYRVVGASWEQTLTCPSASFAKGQFEATTDTFKIYVGSGSPSVSRLVVMKRM